MNQEYTLSIFTENKAGVLSRVISTLTRRKINIDGLTASQSSIEGIYRIIVVVNQSQDTVIKLVAQIDKQIDVIKAFYYDNKDIIYQEVALYKVPTASLTNGQTVEKLVRKHNARIIEIEKEFVVIEKTGLQEETESLLTALRQYGIYEFVRSGRVVVVKPLEQLKNYLNSIKQ